MTPKSNQKSAFASCFHASACYFVGISSYIFQNANICQFTHRLSGYSRIHPLFQGIKKRPTSGRAYKTDLSVVEIVVAGRGFEPLTSGL